MTAAHHVGMGGPVLVTCGFVLASCAGAVVPNAIAMAPAIVVIVAVCAWAAVVVVVEIGILFLELM